MKSKITTRVMAHVANYEKDRISLFTRRLAILFSFIILGVIITFGVVIWQLYEFQAFDMLTLFQQDSEIIARFWQDTLSVFWEFVPQEWLLAGTLCLLVIGAMLFFTRRQRAVNKKKLQQLTQYSH